MDIKASNQKMKALTSVEGLPFDPMRSMTFNSRRAQELAKWSDRNQFSESLHPQLYQAYFVRGENLAETDVLINTVDLSGLNTEDARLSLQSRQYKLAVDEDTVFQAGSISKPAFAAVLMKYREENPLDLDSDVNTLLTSWQLPEHEWTGQDVVSLRRLLSLTASTTVHCFPV